MLTALLTFAATEGGHETSKAAFYIAGSILAAWAVIVGALGIRAHATFPGTASARMGVIGVTALLVAATAATALITS